MSGALLYATRIRSENPVEGFDLFIEFNRYSPDAVIR